MVCNDLREFIEFLENKKELIRIKSEVDPILEVTEITDRISKKQGPALLFEKVKGSPYPIAINLFGSYQRRA
jgi:4-hydroxy-3-polyprenylbenzoate decarboxylase